MLPMETGLEIMNAFRRAHNAGRWDWQITFPLLNSSSAKPILTLHYSQFSTIVWALFNSINDDKLPYTERKSSYAMLGVLAESFGIILPTFKISGYPKVTVEECR